MAKVKTIYFDTEEQMNIGIYTLAKEGGYKIIYNGFSNKKDMWYIQYTRQ